MNDEDEREQVEPDPEPRTYQQTHNELAKLEGSDEWH